MHLLMSSRAHSRPLCFRSGTYFHSPNSAVSQRPHPLFPAGGVSPRGFLVRVLVQPILLSHKRHSRGPLLVYFSSGGCLARTEFWRTTGETAHQLPRWASDRNLTMISQSVYTSARS